MDNFRKDLILLNMLHDIGCIRLKALLEEFKTPEAIFNAPAQNLQNVKGIGKKIAGAIKNARANCNLDEELSLIDKYGIRVISIFEDDYPQNLKNIYDPPFILYVKGELKKTDNLAVAIVGSRRCSHYGQRTAERLAGELGAFGITVVSGLARGIDTAAHRGAIKAKARTIAVLGNGLALTYPIENRKLADEIAQNGAVISEFSMQMPPHKNNFPQRNRIISGLSKAVVVVEAAQRSGALITADLALEQGRDVLAVPGGVDWITSEGTNNLIKEGARLINSADDILEELGINLKVKNKHRIDLPDSCENSIYDMLSDEPSDIDVIVDKLSFQPKKIKASLLNLEMKGIVKQLPGKLYVRAK